MILLQIYQVVLCRMHVYVQSWAGQDDVFNVCGFDANAIRRETGRYRKISLNNKYVIRRKFNGVPTAMPRTSYSKIVQVQRRALSKGGGNR